MTKCINCGNEQLSGAIYCGECGASLLEAENAPDGTEHPFINAPDNSPEPVLIGQDVQPAEKADQITFVIPNSGRHISLSLDEPIRVGRADPTVSLYPEVDLTADGGAEFGVSRLHATINHSEEGVVIVDMSSTNGTLLNHYALPADLPYPLHSGDELRFGDLLVHIFLD